ncbi:MAG: alpha-amylase family glycosyl hydrolase [Bacilli bacterium]
MMKKRLIVVSALLFALGGAPGVKADAFNENGPMYAISVDRFHNGDVKNDGQTDFTSVEGWQGGDFLGVEKKLTHPEGIGFRTIRLSPVFAIERQGNPVPKTKEEMKTIEPRYGGEEAFISLLQTAKERGIAIVLDIPTALYSLPLTAQYDVLRYYATLGVSGFYFYDVERQPVEAWEELLPQIPGAKYAERNDENKAYNALPWTGEHVQSVERALVDSFVTPDRSMGPIIDVWNNLEGATNVWGSIDSRRSDRFVHYSLEAESYPGSRLELALTALFTGPIQPQMTYGSEIGLDGVRGTGYEGYMNFQTESEVIEHVQRLVKVRKDLPALSTGDIEIMQEDNGLTLFKRTAGDQKVYVLINSTSKDQKVKLTEQEVGKGNELRGLLVDDLVRYEEDGYYLVLKRETSNVYVVADEVGVRYDRFFITGLIPIAFLAFLFVVKRRGQRK